MIPKGNQRGGGRQLATHLMNAFDNERVEIADLRGAVAQDLHGAFQEWFAQSKATRCHKYLYSLSVNPDIAKYDLTREQHLDFIARTERSLKLVGQPRAVVFHTKKGRQHCHVVWSRIMPDAGKAVHMDHDRFKLQAVVRAFARDHGLPLPPGMEKNGRSNKDKHTNPSEKQQEDRSALSYEERIKVITGLWQQHKDPRAFVKALEETGFHLARGDSGRYVVIDHAGDVHSLPRQIEGVRSKHLAAFLGTDFPLDKLRDVKTARAAALQDRNTAGKDDAAERAQDAQARRDDLARRHAERRSQLDLTCDELEKRIATERRSLLDLQTAEKDGVLAERAAKQPRGMLAFLARITGVQAYLDARNRRQDATREKAHKAEHDALERRHGRERQEMERRYAALDAVETRERQSLALALKREEFQRARGIRAGGRIFQKLKPEFARAADPAGAAQGGGDSMAAKKAQIMRDFARAAGPQKQKTGESGQSPKARPTFTKGDLQRAFEQAKDPARKSDTGQQERTEEADPDKLEQAREKKDELEKRQGAQERTRKDRGPGRDPGDREH